MRTCILFVVIGTMAFMIGCHASASFILPPNTQLMINDERVSFDTKDDEGRPKLERTPFFWTSIIGIEYALLQDDKIIKKDRLPSEFRIASIFWPPYAYIYRPVGFRFDCYDLSDVKKEFIEKCPADDKKEKEKKLPASVSAK